MGERGAGPPTICVGRKRIPSRRLESWQNRGAHWVNGLLFPVLVALILVGVGLLRGYLHWRAGFDADGRPIVHGGKQPGDEKMPEPVARPWVGPAEMLQAMVTDLDKAPAVGQPHYRYLTLTHRHNDKRCPPEEIETDRKAVPVVAALVLPGKSPSVLAVDANEVVLRLDLRDLGWLADPDWHRSSCRIPMA